MLSRIPDSRLSIFVSGPAQAPLLAPGGIERRFFTRAHQVSSFVQQDSGALYIVNRNLKELGVEGYHLKRKVCRSVRVPVADIGIPPVVGAAKYCQMFKDKSFAFETSLFKLSNRSANLFHLIGLEPIGT